MKKLHREYSILLFMVVTTLMGKFLGLLRDMIIANSYGITYEADAFFVASRIPNSFFDFALSAAIASTFIPIFNRILKKDGKKHAFEYTHRFITLVLIIASIATATLLLFSDQIVHLFGPGLSNEGLALASQLTKLMAPIVFFASITFTFTGLMQSFEHYNVPAAISIFSNVVVIGYLLLFRDTFGLQGLAIALTLGWCVQSLVQMPMMKSEGYVLRLDFKLNTQDIKDTLSMSLPILFTSWAQPITSLVTTNLASYEPGGVAMMEYATRVYIILSGVLIYSITNYIFPKLSKAFSSDDLSEFRLTIASSLLFFTYFSTPVVALVILFQTEIISILFERGAFSVNATHLIAELLGILMIGLYALGIKELLSRIYFAMGDTKTPMRVTLLGIFILIPSSLVFVNYWGLKGLAYASTLSVFLTAFILFMHAVKKNWIDHLLGFWKKTILIFFIDFMLYLSLVGLNIQPLRYGLLPGLIILAGVGILFLVAHILLLKRININLPRIE